MRLRSSVALLLTVAVAGPLAAQATHVVIVTGLSGEAQYATSFHQLGASLFDAARERWRVGDSSLIYLGERPADDPKRIKGAATREAILASLAGLASRVQPNDLVAIFLIGHGSQQGTDPKLSLPGPDLSPGDLVAALAAFGKQVVLVANLSSASGDFLPPLSGPRRIVVTATKTGYEKNATQFGDFFVKGLALGEADADKDGRVSIAEAFAYAKREVARAYESTNRLLTEHALLDDNGDHKGSPDLTGTDGSLAKAVSFALAPEATSSDPEVANLVAERKRLELAIGELRGAKATMDSVAYGKELERLLLKLAETNQAIRAATERKP